MPLRLSPAVLGAALLPLLGCHSQGSEDSSPAAPCATRALPAPAVFGSGAGALPVLVPCPEGWTEVAGTPAMCEPPASLAVAPPSWSCRPGWNAVAGLPGTPQAFSYCEPPEPPEACPAGTMAMVGAAGCMPIGAPCTDSDWTQTTLPDGTVYVRSGSVAGKGTKMQPFGTIASAIAAHPEGLTIALARGQYPEAVAADRFVEIYGACTEDTAIAGGLAGISVLGGGHAILHDLRLDNGGLPTSVSAASTLELHGVRHHSVDGVIAIAGTLRLDHVLFELETPGTPPQAGASLVIEAGGTATGNQVTIETGGYTAVSVGPGAGFRVEDLLVRIGTPSLPSSPAFGVIAGEGDVLLQGALFRHTRGAAIRATKSTVNLQDVDVRDASAVDDFDAVAIDAVQGTKLVGNNLLVDQPQTTAWRAQGADALVQGAVIRNGGGPSGQIRALITANGGGTFELDGVVADTTGRRVILAQDHGGVVVHRSVLTADAYWSSVTAMDGSDIYVDTSLLSSGVAVVEAATGSVTVVDSVMSGPAQPDDLAVAFAAVNEGHVDLARLELIGLAGGVGAAGGASRASMTDCVVRPIAPEAHHPFAFHVLAGGEIVLQRTRLSGIPSVGVYATGADARFVGNDVWMELTEAPPCDGPMCLPGGLWADAGGTIALEGFLLRGPSGTGVRVGTGGSCDLTRGSVLGFPHGFVSDDGDFDPKRAERGVHYQNP